MRKIMLFIAIIWLGKADAQNYQNILNYALNSTPVNGVKIKTNIPFTPASQMPTINIMGYNYESAEPINLSITYYIYSGGTNFSDPENYYFHFPSMSSSGAYTPVVYLSSENGKVVLYINDKSYYQRFTVSVFAQGMSETASWFQGWTAVDEPLAGIKTVEVPYRNRFKGNVYLAGNGIWNAQGNVGIGTATPQEKLAVNGNIRAKEVKVETANWPDYVFKPDYKITSLSDLEAYIKTNGHLPDMPSAKEAETSGIQLGEMNKLLLKKVEELTLHLIEKDSALKAQAKKSEDLEKRMTYLEKKLKKL